MPSSRGTCSTSVRGDSGSMATGCGLTRVVLRSAPAGRIRAVQLNYTEAHAHLQHAIRRAPPATTAPGFVQTAHKFFVVVELLMGDIPERSTFRQPVLRKALAPYFQIVQGG